MSDIKSILSKAQSHSGVITTPQKQLYRPMSSTHPRTPKPNSSINRSTDMRAILSSKPEIKPSKTYRKLFQQEMRSTKDQDLASRKATMKLNKSRKKLRMQKYFKQSPFGRATLIDEGIFVDRNVVDHRHPQLMKKKEQVKSQPLSPTSLRKQIAGNLNQRFNCVTVCENPTNTINNSPKENKKSELSNRVASSCRSGRKFSNKSYFSNKTSLKNPQIQQDFGDIEDPLEQIPNQQKLNKILDMIGDTNLNNILWNDPAVRDIMDQIGIYDEKELDAYLENNTEYFETLFRSSPFTNFNLHYVKPKDTSYNQDFFEKKNSALLNDLPHITDEQYECLAKLHLSKSQIKGKKTIMQSQFVPKQTKLDRVIPPDTLSVGHPQIANCTTYDMNFPNRGDYDPNRIFKRLEEPNVVTGAHWMYKTSYQDSFGRTANSPQPEDLLSIDYIKERNSPRKTLYTKGYPKGVSTYDGHFTRKKASYNRLRSFKYATELEQPINQSLPLEAYETTKNIDSRQIVDKNSEMMARRRKKIAPWKFKILSKLKALMEYKKFLNCKKKH